MSASYPDHRRFLRHPTWTGWPPGECVGTNAFVTTALCSPSRGTFLSGQYASRHGVQNNLSSWNPDTTTFFEPLMAAGYDCAFIGKWHMPGSLPDLRGVNTFITFTAEEGQGTYIDCPLLVDGVMTDRPGTYITDELTTLAIDWIKERPARSSVRPVAGAEGRAPPIRSPTAVRGRIDDADLSDLPPESFAFLSLMDQNIWEGTLGNLETLYRRYCETLLGLDDQVGRLMDYVDRPAERDNTYIVYTSDNGYSWGEHVLTGKRWAYEENTRVPFIAAGPGIEPGTTDELILNADLAPTLLDWAEAEPLAARRAVRWRGSCPAKRAEQVARRFHVRVLLDFPYQVPGMQAVRNGQWLYIEYDSGSAPPAVRHRGRSPHHVRPRGLRSGPGAELARRLDQVRTTVRDGWASVSAPVGEDAAARPACVPVHDGLPWSWLWTRAI